MTPGSGADQPAALAAALTAAAHEHTGSEANFRRSAERALEESAAALGIEVTSVVERSLAGGRADAVFNRLVVEWEPPGKLAAHIGHPGNKDAVQQLERYLRDLAAEERREVDRLVGVACDGAFMIFTRYRIGRWIVDEPVPVDALSAGKLLESLLATQSGRALTAVNLLGDFGPDRPLTRSLARALLDQLNTAIGHEPGGLTARLYLQWETFFAVATGVVGAADELKRDAREPLATIFGLPEKDLDPARALFALQTYFAIVTKLIALLALSLFVEGVEIRVDELKDLDDESLREDLEDLQNGEPFRAKNLANALEPDVFGWYLGDWSSRVREGLRELLARLADYDPKTLEVSPEDARDLLKDLYQGLLPRPVRHALGQYFTPDWLAERLLQEVGYEGQPALRLVDPSCGTGTFLVLAINRLKESLRRQRVPEPEILEIVLTRIVGFDIDPLAVVASRTNYLLALGSLLRAAGKPLDVPVYLADSIVGPVEGETLMSAGQLELPTAAGTFALPACVDTERELRFVCDHASRGIENGWSADEFGRAAAEICEASASEQDVLEGFYEQCLGLHRRGLGTLWPYVLRNAFMPAFVERFDLVVGNPPWVNWESLPRAYREKTMPLWRRYGLFVHGGMAAMMGAGKKDVAMLLSYVVSDKLLRDGGRLGFVVTQTVFKTAGAGQGFRRLRIGELGAHLRVEQVDDMIDLHPFVGATNRTALFTWRKGEQTVYPVNYVLWQRLRPARISEDATLEEVEGATRTRALVAAPVSASDPTSAWLSAPAELVEPLRRLAETGKPAYAAHAGVYAGLNGVYWLSVEGPPDQDGRLPVSNLNEEGRTRIAKSHGRVEAELVHPLVRGSDVSRWSAKPSAHILFVQDPKQRCGIDEESMRDRYPGALRYLEQFETLLRNRALYRRYYSNKTSGDAPPYWSMFDVGDYTLTEYKVVWKDQASDFTAAVLTGDEPLALPNHKVILVACESDDEAHYLCGALNSVPVRLFVACYAIETQISTHTVTYVHVPKFDPRSRSHQALAEASRRAHEAVANGRAPDQSAVDRAAARIWQLRVAEVEAMRVFFAELRKRDLAVL
ncbi:MAG: N-6 DNA methylase [Gaiellaceae bacterium MAG52_C11]|nr:N-6 DNA methylase [Candidatus Gaiellasilicea maunaloa]